MATVAATGIKTICNIPYLKKKISCTGGTTAATILHGEAYAPDVFWVVSTDGANPTQTGIGVQLNSTTGFDVDCVVDVAETFDIIAIWIPQVKQNGQSIRQDNNT